MDTQSPVPPASSSAIGPDPLDRAACLRLEQALYREWLETDGLGGYASSSVHLCPTRRYHGLLVAPLPEGGERHVFLSRLEEELVGPNRTLPLSTGRYPGTYSPDGFQSIESFRLAPHPIWTYRFGEVEIQREIMAIWGQHTVLVRWVRRGGPESIKLRLRPLLACRRSHDLTWENIDLNPRVEKIDQGIVAKPYDILPALTATVHGSGYEYEADPVWYRQVEYPAEQRRGFPAHEDHFAPGKMELDMPDGEAVYFAATIGEPVRNLAALWEQEQGFRRSQWQGVESFADRLTLSSDAYLYQDAHGRTGILAGYPWFDEWGRDTFLALPGMTLPTERMELCQAVLRGALPFLRGGLLPNVFGADPESSSYRSADAALWFARAIFMYHRASDDYEAVAAEFRPGLTSIAEAYLDGTELGVRVDTNGRLFAGSTDLNATWMDAMVNGQPVTPREGSPVELQALWYQLVAHLAEIASRMGEAEVKARWDEEANKAGKVLTDQFWLPQVGYLADRLAPSGAPDSTIRPNAVLAVSLELSPFDADQKSKVVQKAIDELLTPRGLRTLSPHDPDYIGRYEGGPEQRDGAYHQGTVWPWLLGFLVEAALRVYPREGARVREIAEVVEGFQEHLSEHGLAHISEVFDGDPPHRPGGTPAQAWSVSEILRALSLLESGGV